MAMLMRLLAPIFNAFPVRWQRRLMTAANARFLVGVTGLGVDAGLAIEVGPVLEVITGFRWARVELVFAFRVTGGTEALTAEVAELAWFPVDALPDVRADQRGLIERNLGRARDWAAG